MVDLIEEVELVAVRQSQYTMYVFKKLNSDGYIMCTRLPSWNTPNISIGEKGFLNYQIVKAGEFYYNPTTDKTEKYRYSNIYFMNFINKSEVKENSIII